MKQALAVLLLILLTSISVVAALQPQQQEKLPPPTLRINNRGPYDFVVLLQGRRIGNAPGGRSSCIRLVNVDAVGPHYIALRAMASDAVIVAPAEFLPRSRGWRIEIGMSPSIEIHSLQPAAACGPKDAR